MDKTDPNARTRLINGLLTATATILPTIANAQDAMLGVVAPEKSPEGGSRRDRVQLVSRALSYAARGKYEKARRNIDKMRNQVTKAFTFRSTPTELFRTDTNDPTSFEINRLNPKDFKSKELQSPRDNAAKWMQFVWFTQETVKFVIEKLKEQGLSSLVGQYEAAVNEQLGSYATVPVHDIVAKWNAALGEGTFTINKTLSPQALLGLPKNHQEPVLL